jgi:hypothetical protein
MQIQQMTPDTEMVDHVQQVRVKRSCIAKHALTTIILVLCFAGPAATGPLEDATAAYDRGDYAIALRLIRALAEQGDPSPKTTSGRCIA